MATLAPRQCSTPLNPTITKRKTPWSNLLVGAFMGVFQGKLPIGLGIRCLASLTHIIFSIDTRSAYGSCKDSCNCLTFFQNI